MTTKHSFPRLLNQTDFVSSLPPTVIMNFIKYLRCIICSACHITLAYLSGCFINLPKHWEFNLSQPAKQTKSRGTANGQFCFERNYKCTRFNDKKRTQWYRDAALDTIRHKFHFNSCPYDIYKSNIHCTMIDWLGSLKSKQYEIDYYNLLF